MDISQQRAHSFVIRIWLEETTQESGQTVWRGHITHVPGGERRYLRDLNEIPAIMTQYLIEESAQAGTRSWIKKWFNAWKR